jgi:bifunctional UDP-N-acetylglucosamine pyrophosphorylase/glucosamine-1-phosphate N-acetyltransferase
MDKIAAVIMAAGKGTRMKSNVPKVVHRLAGRPLIQYPVDLAEGVGCSPVVVVVGHGRDLVEAELRGHNGLSFALQAEQLGTGHALMSALPKLRGHKGAVLILSGDVPLLDKVSVSKLKKAYKQSGGLLALITFRPRNPFGYGRIVRDGKKVVDIREEKDCTRAEKAIDEVNGGIYIMDIGFLRRSVKKLKSDNKQGEFYLTDLVKMAAQKGGVGALEVEPQVVSGINDRVDLAAIEALVHEQVNLELMRSGVTICHPPSVHIDVGVKVGRDTHVGADVQLAGDTVVGSGCVLERGVVIKNSVVDNGVHIKPYSVIEDATIRENAQVGPMARLRPGTDLGKGSKVGNFVEIKNTVLGAGSKASHLSYLGDGQVGERVNMGAGTIFCNYDGFLKHKTVLEDEVFIGSDSQLVAPVVVGRGAYVASGSTITRNVPPDALAVARSRQENKDGLAAILRAKLISAKEKLLREQDKVNRVRKGIKGKEKKVGAKKRLIRN